MAVGTDDGALQLFDISGSAASSPPGAPPLLSQLQAPGSGPTTVSVSLSGDGSVLGAGSGQKVMIWRRNGNYWLLQYELTGHFGAVRSVAVSLNGRHAHSGGCDATVRAWDLTVGLQAGLAMYIGGTSSCASLVAVAADGRSVAAAGDGDPLLRFWATWVATSG
jgi:WD40 repeat protein